MIRFSWDTGFQSDLKKFAKNIDRMEHKLEDRTNPIQKIKKRQVKRWAANFSRQGAIYDKWDPLHASTIRRRIRGSGTTPLVETGGLFSHFVEMNEAGEITNDSVTWNFYNRSGFSGGAQNILGQHFGINPNKGLGGGMEPVPARVLWDFNQEDREAAEDIMSDWVFKIVETYFGV